mmetsp:Transcript_13510/g.34652  ORF Transcript_13510/g.34652 Transcript_13510/m.34652 type:complete len:88 (-) Transcript_13510:383-646(-)
MIWELDTFSAETSAIGIVSCADKICAASAEAADPWLTTVTTISAEELPKANSNASLDTSSTEATFVKFTNIDLSGTLEFTSSISVTV